MTFFLDFFLKKEKFSTILFHFSRILWHGIRLIKQNSFIEIFFFLQPPLIYSRQPLLLRGPYWFKVLVSSFPLIFFLSFQSTLILLVQKKKIYIEVIKKYRGEKTDSCISTISLKHIYLLWWCIEILLAYTLQNKMVEGQWQHLIWSISRWIKTMKPLHSN